MLTDKYKYQDSNTLHHSNKQENKPLPWQKQIREWLYKICKNLRVAHRVPLYVDGQVQVPGLEQVPPFEQAGEHTAKTEHMY